MKTIPHMHDYFSDLPESVRLDLEARSRQRKVCKGEAVYRHGDTPLEMYQLITGGVKLCNYSIDGREFIGAEFRPGDCVGEMGLIDGLPRVSHAIATEDSLLRVVRKEDFDYLARTHFDFSERVMLTLCRRLRWAYGLNLETSGLALQQRLALHLFRLAQSHGTRDEEGGLYISISQEELGRMLGASRQTVNKELKILMEDGCVDLRYGKIYVNDLEAMCEKYEALLGTEQITSAYERSG
jgi:CRP-like cAMP-binding protein